MAVAARPAARDRRPARQPGCCRILTLVFASRRLRTCMLFGWLVAVYTVPSALAVPVAASLGGGAAAAGLIFAAGPFGIAAGTVAYNRAGAARQARWMGPLAVLCCGSLALFAVRPGLAWSLVIITVSGALGSFQARGQQRFHGGAAPGPAGAGLRRRAGRDRRPRRACRTWPPAPPPGPRPRPR